jgi:hypothetical protein
MSNAGKLLAPGTQSNLANVNFSGTVTISENGGTLNTHGPLNIGGPATVGGVSLAGAVSQQGPASFGLIAYNYSPVWATGTGSAVTTAGKVYLAQLPLPGNTAITNLWISVATAASGLTTAENWAGIYNSAGSLLAQTGDLTTTIGTNTGFIKCPLSSVYTTSTSPGVTYVGVVFNAGTTQPVLSAYTGFVTVTTSVASFGSSTTFGNTAATYPFSLAASSSNTVLPSSVTMSTNTATGAYTMWVGAN